MKVSWNKINQNMEQIIDEFEKLYIDEKNFSECEKILKDIFNIFSSKYNIKLDENEDFDHVFHQLFDRIQNVMKSSDEPLTTGEYAGFKNVNDLFKKMSEDVFKTAEIRGRLREIDPTNKEYKAALEKGIEEAEARKVEIRGQLSGFKAVSNEIYEAKIPNLKVLTRGEFDSLDHLTDIKDKLEQIKKLQDMVSSHGGSLSQSQIDANNNRINSMRDEIKDLVEKIKPTKLVDEKSFNIILGNDVQKGISETDKVFKNLNAKATSDFTVLLDNLKKAAKDHSDIYSLKNIQFSNKLKPSTPFGRKLILEACEPFNQAIESLEADIKLYNEEINVYDNQIHLLDEEDKVLQAKAPTIEDIKANIPASIQDMKNQDLNYYASMVRAQMYGNKEYKEKFDRYLALFKKHIKSDSTFILRNEDGTEIMEQDENGNPVPKVGKYSTVDYIGMQTELNTLLASPENASKYENSVESIVKFLQLEEYKSKLERSTKITAGDKLTLTEYKGYDAYKNASTQEEKSNAMNQIKMEMLSDGKYIDTFHNTANDYMFHKEHHRTAGKYADTNLPLKRIKDAEGLSEKVKTAAYNVYAFSRWQNPLKAPGVIRKVLTLGANVANIGTMPVRLPLKGIGVAISNIKYKGEKDPNPYNGRADARRGARVEYYNENGNNRFVARAKGWLDELPLVGTKRKERTEKAIVDRQISEIDKNLEKNYIDATVAETQAEYQRQKDVVLNNIEMRKNDARIIASTQEIQGDIYRHPKDVDENVLRRRTLSKLALEYEGIDSAYVSSTGSRNPAENPRRNTQFVKDKEELKRNISGVQAVTVPEGIRWTRSKQAVISADPIGRAIRSKEIKNTLTRLYTIPYLLALKGQHELVKYGVGKIKDTVQTMQSVPEQVGERTISVPSGAHFEDVTPTDIPHIEGNTAGNIKLGDLEYGNSAMFEHTGTYGKTVNWLEAPTSQNIQAMSLDFVIPDNLDAQTYETLANLGYKAGDRVCYSIADEATRNLCQATGKRYATSYIDGLFSFDDSTKIVDAVDMYFPDKVKNAFETILESEAYAGNSGVEFMTDSFATSHGITDIMQSMKGWGTGWATESVKAEALETARVFEEVSNIVPEKKLVIDYVLKDVPIYENVDKLVNIPNEARIALKGALNKVNNGITGAATMESAYELFRKAKLLQKESGRETFDDERE